MKKNDKKELAEKSAEELRKMLTDAKREFMDQSLEKEQGKLTNTSSLTNTRKRIAFISTVISQKEKIKNA